MSLGGLISCPPAAASVQCCEHCAQHHNACARGEAGGLLWRLSALGRRLPEPEQSGVAFLVMALPSHRFVQRYFFRGLYFLTQTS